MKNKLIVLFLLFFLVPPSLYAGSVSGKVYMIRSHDTGVSRDWVKLVGVTSAGSCSTHGGYVNFALGDDDRAKRHLAMLTSAMMADRAVSINYYDVTSGGCEIRYLDLS